MYKLLHVLFGWNYIHWHNTVSQGICRVHVTALGEPYYWRYWGVGVLDRIQDRNQVLWLTCDPKEYGL